MIHTPAASEIRRSGPGPIRDLLNLVWRQPLWAVPFGLFFGLVNGGGGGMHTYLLAYRISLVFSFFIGLGLWVARHGLLPRMRDDDGHLTPLRIGLMFGLSCLVASYVAAIAVHFTVMPGFLGTTRNILVSGAYTLLFFALFSGINFAIAYYHQALDRSRALETMRAELAEAELRALRAQINPHFLFNTLNTIAALIRSDPAIAEDTTTRLADIFRYALHASDRPHSRLADELGFLRDYLDIERTRFGDRIVVEESIAPETLELMVPSLLLQPMVENAIRHGLAPRPVGGRVTLGARRDGDLLRLTVADDGAGFEPVTAASGQGFGLRSVRERLRAAGPPHELLVDSAPGRGTRITVVLPATVAAKAAEPATVTCSEDAR